MELRQVCHRYIHFSFIDSVEDKASPDQHDRCCFHLLFMMQHSFLIEDRCGLQVQRQLEHVLQSVHILV